MITNQANWKPASVDMTENTDGSLYVSFQNSTLKATSSGGLEAIPTSKIEKERRRNFLRTSGSFAGLPMLSPTPLSSWTIRVSPSTRTRQCSTIPVSPCKMYLPRTFAPESTIRKISRGRSKIAKQGWLAACRLKSSNECSGRTVSIAGSSSVTTRSTTNRDVWCAGMQLGPISMTASAPRTGHERGSFTGATQRRLGRFESADGGTIFLDEVGDLPPETQVALLRVLQEREFERVGGSHTVSVDVRVIAATNRDLTTAVAEGTFRQDLFYRLNVFPIQVPALRERVSDISLLVGYLIDRYAQKAGKKIRNIDKKTMELFHAYDWPGNIRELQNVVERAVILCEGETFFVDEAWLKRVAPESAMTSVTLVANLAAHEREMLEAALRESEGVVGGPTGAAA